MDRRRRIRITQEFRGIAMKVTRATPAIAGPERSQRPRLLAWLLTCGLGITVVTAGPARAATVRVQYLSNSSVYLDAGRGVGLVEGTVLRVERQGRLVAELVVDFVASNSASCTIRSSSEPLQAGDICTFTPTATAEPPAAMASPGTSPIVPARAEPGVWARLGAVRGSVSTGYAASKDNQGRYANPAFRADLRWRGEEREELSVRARADRPVLSDVATDAFSSARPRDVRIYEASVRYRMRREALEFEAGRHFPNQLEAIGPIDGAAVRWHPTTSLRVGAAAGRYANLPTAGLESQDKRGGVFVEVADPRVQGVRRWRTLLAALRLDDTDVTRRQFVQWRTDASIGPRVRVFENLEVDVNPGWKQALGEGRLEATRFSLTGQVDVHPRVGLTGGYDYSRDPLLPEQRTITTVLSRDRRRLAHGAARFKVAKHVSLRLGTLVRLPAGEDGTLYNWDGSVIASNLGKTGVTLTAHGTHYDTRFGTGNIADGSMSWLAGRQVRLELGGGTTATEALALTDASSSTVRFSWVRTGVDIQAGRGVWIAASGELRTSQSGREITLELGRQF